LTAGRAVAASLGRRCAGSPLRRVRSRRCPAGAVPRYGRRRLPRRHWIAPAHGWQRSGPGDGHGVGNGV